MKILIASHRFAPSIGGVERVGGLLARSFAELGHAVKVITRTEASGSLTEEGGTPRRPEQPGEAIVGATSGPLVSNIISLSRTGQDAALREPGAPGTIEILRCPSAVALLHAARWCDVFLHNNLRLQTAWPLLVVRRPWVMVHHTWLARGTGGLGWQDRLKRIVLRWGSSVAVSTALARSLPVASVVLPNPYDDALFVERPEIPRDHELIFVGRLVLDKGVDVLIEALAHLRTQGLTPRLTIVGEGPESTALKVLAFEQGVKSQVQFVGAKTGLELVRLLNQHRILVVPSRWQEPFGLVALEGIACGGVVVGSAGGGLPEAIGPCGVTFPNGNIARLAEALADLLRYPAQWAGYRAQAPAHLRKHQRRLVAQAYLGVLENAAQHRPNPFEVLPRRQEQPWDRAA